MYIDIRVYPWFMVDCAPVVAAPGCALSSVTCWPVSMIYWSDHIDRPGDTGLYMVRMDTRQDGSVCIVPIVPEQLMPR